MGSYTLWCLNRVGTWNLDDLAGALANKSWFAKRHEIALGQRTRDRGPGGSKLGVLSHEDGPYDEYFVPIPVKCIGDPDAFLGRFGPDMTDEGRTAFRELTTGAYAALFQDDAWRRHWTLDGEVGMFTAPDGVDGVPGHQGFYQLVCDQANKSGSAVLVGYSQGGLVAHFLAYIDERWMKQRAIAGLITVQAPNHGSPLANPAHKDSVGEGLFGVLAGVAGFPIPPPGESVATGDVIRLLVRGRLEDRGNHWHADVGTFAKFLEAAKKDTLPGSSKRDLVLTARKWLTGLLPVTRPTAFSDLDPRKLDQRGTILDRLTSSPLGSTLHGAIIGADNGLTDFIAEGRFWLEDWLIRWLTKRPRVAAMLRAAEDGYGQIAMYEGPQDDGGGALGPKHAALAKIFRTGSRPLGLSAYAHDFVIPSVSQAMHQLSGAAPPPSFLGNVVNLRGTHLSGASSEATGSDKPLVETMLKELGARLS